MSGVMGGEMSENEPRTPRSIALGKADKDEPLRVQTSGLMGGETLDTSTAFVSLPEAEYEALVSALRALCEGEDAGIAFSDKGDCNYCLYCGVDDEDGDFEHHAPDCPIRVARALLAGGTG